MEVEENRIKMCIPCTDICPKGELHFEPDLIFFKCLLLHRKSLNDKVLSNIRTVAEVLYRSFDFEKYQEYLLHETETNRCIIYGLMFFVSDTMQSVEII